MKMEKEQRLQTHYDVTAYVSARARDYIAESYTI